MHTFTMFRPARWLALGALAIAGSSFAATDGITDTTIRLGMSSPLSGPTGAYGRQMKEGIEACFARVNAAGGVHGKKL